MTGVERLEELIRALETHPEERARLARALLGRDDPTETWSRIENALRELAETDARIGVRMDRLTNTVERLAEGHDQLNSRVDHLTATVQQLAEGQDQLNSRVDHLTTTVQRLAEGQDRLTSRFDHLTATVERLAEGQDRLTKSHDRLDLRFEGLRGSVLGERYEARTRRNAFYIFRGGREFPLEERVGQSLHDETLAPDEARDLMRLDFAWEKSPRGSGRVVFAIEVSVVVDESDVERAGRRARFLAKIAGQGCRVLPVVIGDRWDRIEAKDLAGQESVGWVIEDSNPKVSPDLEPLIAARPAD